ncbi:MAG: type II toxin-antitoxin system Phd/YefM family antitoxin [Pseudonocardiales bacterium]|nr:type II toxin-antitoxin system Phd/YefM family antitoxin [Pseudonocardiales bacterium]
MMTAAGIELSEAKIYTMRELNQNTAQVLDEINRSGRPAAVTKHGRFVALITPLLGAQIESLVLSQGKMADELHRRAADSAQTTYSAQQAAKRVRSHYQD